MDGNYYIECHAISEMLDAFSFELCPLMGNYAKKTVEVAYEDNITVYDAQYISLAMIKRTHIYKADMNLRKN